MSGRSSRRWAGGAAALMCILALAPAAQAEDFFSALFGGFGGGRRHGGPSISLPFGDGGPVVERTQRPRYGGGGQAYCVRTCDGRYFPLTAADDASRAASCNSFCPASETRVVYGSAIDNAAGEDGKPYSALPNAFRYRNEIV